MVKKLTIVFALFFLSALVRVQAQGLQPVCQNYSTIDYIEDQEFHSAVADNKGTIYFATNFGVLIYKGERKSQAKGWDFLLLPDPEIIYSLYLDTAGNRLYIGGETQLGYFQLDNYFSGEYVSLNEKRPEETRNTQVWHINKIKDKLVFHTVKGLLVLEGNTLRNLPPPAEAIFHNVFEYDGRLLINTITKGWYVYDGSLHPLKGSEDLPQDKCYGVTYSGMPEHVMFVYRNAGIIETEFLEGAVYRPKKISSDAFDRFLGETQVYAVQYSMHSDYLILATLNKGAFIIRNKLAPEPQFFDMQDIISETSAATQIKSAMGLFRDKQNNTWILGKTNLSVLPSDLTLFYNTFSGTTIQSLSVTSNGIYAAAKNGFYKISVHIFEPDAVKKISDEVYKKTEADGSMVYCLRDYALDRYDNERLVSKGSEFFLNDFCNAEGTIWLATENGIRSSDDKPVALEGGNVLQLLYYNTKFYALVENKGMLILDRNLKILNTVPFNNEFKTLNLAKLFVYNNAIVLRNIDNTFKLNTAKFEKLNASEVRKIWAHETIHGVPDGTKKDGLSFTFEYDGQNNTYLYLTTGDKTVLANAFKSSVEINDIVQAGNAYLIGTKSGLFVGPLHMPERAAEKVNIFSLNADSVQYDLHSEIFIPYAKSRNIEALFSLTGFYNKADNTSYRYRLIGDDTTWKDNYLTRLTFKNLSPGKYTLEVIGYYGNSLQTGVSAVSFTIGKPWWQTWWAILLFVLAGLLVIYGIVQASVYRLKQSKIRLEKIVTERTQEIAAQKDEIEHKNKEITDSINYAKRIQSALLTDEAWLQENFSNAFILYLPKDIVSGDYYWFNTIDGIECIVVADCTGHGVPGAFMSMLGVAKLNEIKAEKVNRPDLILNRLNRLIFETLGQGKPNTDSRDGMDMAIITIDRQNNKLRYAGANRSLIIVDRETGQLEEIKATKIPVGGSQYGPDRNYQLHEMEIKSQTSFFLTTDGYADQFGGPAGKKFMTKKLNELFVQIAGQAAPTQKQQLTDTYLDWKKNVEQVDDVCVFGINF
jgi:serine phosphatase RsbU (regulator of sigma subunit)